MRVSSRFAPRRGAGEVIPPRWITVSEYRTAERSGCRAACQPPRIGDEFHSPDGAETNLATPLSWQFRVVEPAVANLRCAVIGRVEPRNKRQ